MDAARINPYPFVVHQVPDNPSKKKRQRSRPSPPDDQPRFNTGPVRHPPSASRRLPRNGTAFLAIPDYPPPTFQEAINTGPLSQSSLSLPTAPISSIPDDSPEELTPRPVYSVPRMEIDPINDLTPLEDTSESDDSALVIVNKNEVPVCSTDFPPAKHESKKDWFKRRKQQETPLPSTSALYKKSHDSSRGRNLPRITIPINPDPSGLSPEVPLSSPKRRFLSLSPIKTIFPSKNPALQERPLTVTNSSPSSPQSSLGNKNFFRSATSLSASLSASSLLRLPVSQKTNSLSRRLFTHKGKERATEPVVHENLHDNWEVVDRTADAERVDTVRVHAEDHPQSLMSVVMDSFSANCSTTTFLRNSPTHTKSRSITPSDESHSPGPTAPLTSNPDAPKITPPLEGQKFSVQQRTDTPQTSLSPTPLARTPTSSQPQSQASISHEASQRLIAPQSSSVAIDLHTTDKSNLEASVSMPTNHESKDPALGEKLPPPLVPVAVWSSPTASRSIPDLLTYTTDLPSHHAVCSCGTTHNNMNPSFKSIPLGRHMYSGAYRTSTPPQAALLTKTSAAVEDPTRAHYASRPLPRPPPFPDVQKPVMNSVLTAGGKSASENTHKEGKGKEKEGLLIDLEDTSLDPKPRPSLTMTVRSGSDESRYHSQVYLPLLPSPASSAAASFSREPLPSL